MYATMCVYAKIENILFGEDTFHSLNSLYFCKRTMKRHKYILILLIAGILMSGCFIFRPKNKCNDCPSWNKHQGH